MMRVLPYGNHDAAYLFRSREGFFLRRMRRMRRRVRCGIAMPAKRADVDVDEEKREG